MQKQVKDELRQEKFWNSISLETEKFWEKFWNSISLETEKFWEKFWNSISLETDSSESWRKIKNFLKPKGQCDYPTFRHDDKVAKTNADKA